MKGNYEERECETCKRKYYVPKGNANQRGRPSGVRPRNSINCSPKCSRKYLKDNA